MQLIVVGGGAAGFFAAIRAREVNPRLQVDVLEALSKPLGKVLISGGGRCNVTTSVFEPARLVQYYPRGARPLRGLFERFGPRDTVAWFEARGVRLKTEPDGRIFPVTDDSRTIIDCLLDAARASGVRLRTKAPVTACKRLGGGFRVDDVDADFLLLASGSTRTGYDCARALGHSLIPPVPSLFTFNVRDPRLEGLAGVSVPRAVGTLRVGAGRPVVQDGPLLVTHWGLSGPLVLRLSAWGARPLHEAGYRAELLVDFVPDASQEMLRAALLGKKNETARRHVANDFPVDLPRRLWHSLARNAGVAEDAAWGQVPNAVLNRLAEHLKRSSFRVEGKGAFKEEFVTAGGVPLDEVDFRTMQSRVCPGLYLAGEILDVDALTGGFNFQNAWSTGWLAGESIGGESRTRAEGG